MKNNLVKKLSFLTLVYLVISSTASYAQPNLKEVTSAITGSTPQVVIILNWLLGIAGGIGAVVVGFKLFLTKPDAKEGIMYWVGGIIFCIAAAIVINNIK